MSSQWHGGKGSKPRKVDDREQFESNWDLIFNNKRKENEKDDRDERDLGVSHTSKSSDTTDV